MKVEGEEERERKRKLNAKYEAQRKEQKGKPLCEVLSPDLAKEAEIEFTRQIEADTLVDAKTPKTFKLESPIKVTDDFKEAVAVNSAASPTRARWAGGRSPTAPRTKSPSAFGWRGF